jgi:putative transposase
MLSKALTRGTITVRTPFAKLLQESARILAEARGLAVRELQVLADHVHRFVSAPPTETPVGIVKALRGIMAKLMSDQYPGLRTAFRTGHLWRPSCYVGTGGHVSQETVLKYVGAQKACTVGG